MIFESGRLFSLWLARRRIKNISPQKVSSLILDGAYKDIFSAPVTSFIDKLRSISTPETTKKEIDMENLLQETSLDLWKSLDNLKILIRVGPGLGLMGTLIPMGTGLAALGQGDIARLSSDLVIAFTTTVVGLAIGMSAYTLYTIKKRWVERDIKDMELVTEIFSSKELRELK